MRKGLFVKKSYVLFLTYAILASFLIRDVNAQESKGLPNGYYIVKLGMQYGELQKKLAENGFKIKSRGLGSTTYVSTKPIQGYDFIASLEYSFHGAGRFWSGPDDSHSETIVEPYFRTGSSYYERLWCALPNRNGDSFNVDNDGISFMPSQHLMPDSNCKYPSDFGGNVINFPILNSDQLISFVTVIYLKEPYKKDFLKNFLSNFTQKYGPPNAKVRSYGSIRTIAWYDKDTFIRIRTGGDDPIDIRYISMNQDKFIERLKSLEVVGDSLKEKCEKERNERTNKSIKLQ